MTRQVTPQATRTDCGRLCCGTFVLRPEEWPEVKRAVVAIERACFARGAYTERQLEEDFTKRCNVAVVLTLHEMLVGYTVAQPKVRWFMWRAPVAWDTAYVMNTAVVPEWQGQGLVAMLGAALDDELRRRGYRFVERDAAVENGYADKLMRAYAGRVLARRDHASKYGPQRFMRIAL